MAHLNPLPSETRGDLKLYLTRTIPELIKNFTQAGVIALALFLCGGCTSTEVSSREETARANAQASIQNPVDSGLYRIMPGDGLRIDFLYDEDFNRGVLVRPDGYISLPLIEDVQVGGKTVPEVRKTLSERYKGILKNPNLVVSLDSTGGKIYVGGEVATPGIFTLSDGVTTLRAIAMAGGAKNTAGLRSVLVIRDKGTPEPEYLLMDLKAGTSELDSKQDMRLQAKDIVVVPKSRIAKADQFVEQYINQLIPFQKSLSVTYLFGQPLY